MGLTIDLETARTAFRDSVTSFVRAVDDFDEMALLGSSRCHGWTRLDVVVHVIGGWQEMLGGFVSPVDERSDGRRGVLLAGLRRGVRRRPASRADGPTAPDGGLRPA